MEECRTHTPQYKTIRFCECGFGFRIYQSVQSANFIHGYIFISGGSVECSDKSEDECVSKTIDGDDNDSDDAKLFKKLVNEGSEPGTDYSNNDQSDESRRGKIGTLKDVEYHHCIIQDIVRTMKVTGGMMVKYGRPTTKCGVPAQSIVMAGMR